MTKIAITISAISTMSILMLSCTKLNENPQGSLTPINFYQTQSDAVAAVTAVYITLTTDINNDFPVYGRNLNLIVDNTSDTRCTVLPIPIPMCGRLVLLLM
jgi:hypothetical protein